MKDRQPPARGALTQPSETLDSQREAAPVGRRRFLQTAAIGGLTTGATLANGEPLTVPEWMKTPGQPFRGYGSPATTEAATARGILQPYKDFSPEAGVSMTPLEKLDGTITPNGLHFERHHNGVPVIDPGAHRLLIHGLVDRNLTFSVEDLLRYPKVSRICFVECAGNSFFNPMLPEPIQMPCGMIHGLISNAEWTGVPLRILLEEAGVQAGGTWLLAEGADSAAMSRSIPIEKAMDDALLALYQNGERIRPEQGYPLRLVLPGWEGNMQVKWLRRLRVGDGPMYTKDETSKYSDSLPDGRAHQFTFPMAVKSVITNPSAGMRLPGPGWHEITGLAWSGSGKVLRVEISTDSGANWTDAALQEPVLSQALTRFRLPFEWQGSATKLLSRATDESGAAQPGYADWKAQYQPGQVYHYNAVQTWQIAASGEVSNVFS